MRLKILVSVVLALVVSYVIFWHYMAGEVETRIEAWISQQRSRGLSVSYENLDISGFPYRMELSLKALSVIKTGRGHQPVRFTSPHITLVAFPWKINHGVIISDGGDLRIGDRRHPKLTMNFGKTRSSVLIDLASRNIKRVSFVFDKVTWAAAGKATGRGASAARDVRLHIIRPEQSADVPGAFDSMELPVQMKLYLEAKDVIAQAIPVGIFGKKADQIKIDLQLHGKIFPAYSKDSLVFWRDNGGTLEVKNFEIMSGEMDLELDGEVTLDQELKPLGAFSSKVHGVDHIVGVLSRHPAFQGSPGNMILQELKRMNKVEETGEYQGKKVLDLAISLQGGFLFLGPIPVYELTPVIE